MQAAGPEVVACGDVLGVVFDGEDEAVVFAPDSGDVLISEAGQWHRLTADTAASNFTSSAIASAVPPAIPSQPHGASEQPLTPDTDLRAILFQLGLNVG